MTSCSFRKPLGPGLGESQEGLPEAGLQSQSSESREVVAVKDFTDDN